MSNKLMPLQLSHILRSLFFGMWTIKVSFHSWGTRPSLQTWWKSFTSRLDPQHSVFNIVPHLQGPTSMCESWEAGWDMGLANKWGILWSAQNILPKLDCVVCVKVSLAEIIMLTVSHNIWNIWTELQSTVRKLDTWPEEYHVCGKTWPFFLQAI